MDTYLFLVWGSVLCEPSLHLHEQPSKKHTGIRSIPTLLRSEHIYKISDIYRTFYKNKFRLKTNLLWIIALYTLHLQAVLASCPLRYEWLLGQDHKNSVEPTLQERRGSLSVTPQCLMLSLQGKDGDGVSLETFIDKTPWTTGPTL